MGPLFGETGIMQAPRQDVAMPPLMLQRSRWPALQRITDEK
jgi:hypothetical protein